MDSIASPQFNFEDNFILSQLKVSLPTVVKDHEAYWNAKLFGKLSQQVSERKLE